MASRMTRARLVGSDKPFAGWIRNNPELPSQDANLAVAVSDIDLIVHNYLRNGSHTVQHVILLGVKSRGGHPQFSRVDTLWKTVRRSEYEVRGQRVVVHGVFFLVLSGESVEDSERMEFCRCPDGRSLLREPITEGELIRLLRFETAEVERFLYGVRGNSEGDTGEGSSDGGSTGGDRAEGRCLPSGRGDSSDSRGGSGVRGGEGLFGF